MTEVRPGWLNEPCPAWCSRDHAHDEHREDRYHQSEPSIAPAVAGSGRAVPLTASLAPVDLVVRLGRQVGCRAEWIVIEALESDVRLVLTAESAAVLADLLHEQLERSRADS